MKNRIIIATVLVMATFCLFSSITVAMEVEGVNIHGFVSQGFLMSDQYNYLTENSKDGSFAYNEAGINFSKSLTDKLLFGIQLFSRDLGDVANNKVTIDWAYGDYRLKDWFGIRAGRIKLPIGLYNETRDIDMLRTGIVMPQSIYSDLLRDTSIAANGVGIYGNVDLSAVGSIDYQAVAGQMNIDNDSGFEKWFNSRFTPLFSLAGSTDTDTAYVGNLRWNTPLDGLVLGISGMTVDAQNPILTGRGASMTQETSSEIIRFFTEYTWKNLLLASEYQTFKTESIIGPNESEVTSENYYLSASYRFTDLFSLGTHYSVVYPNKDDKDGEKLAFKSAASEKDLALSLRFDINEYIVFKVEGHKVDGTAKVNEIDNPDRTEDDFYYGAAKVTFSF